MRGRRRCAVLETGSDKKRQEAKGCNEGAIEAAEAESGANPYSR